MNLDFDVFLTDLLAWSAQICVLAAVGALAVMTLAHPRARLLFWQGLLAIALLLPLVEPRIQPATPATGEVSVATGPFAIADRPAAGFHFHWRSEYVLALLAAGAALRWLWIGVGLAHLRRHRLAARALADAPLPLARRQVNWYVSDTVTGPVTFGWLRPSILLPSRVNQLPAELREAIACHELIHVQRRDWLFVIGEELVRGALWFHPAIWLVLGRIQLAREQVVDLEAVRLTNDRERYLDALVEVAAQKLQPDVAPAPLFLKKRQLAVRVAAVLKEVRMSKSRMVASFATVSSAALIAAGLAVWFFPLHSAPPVSAQSALPDNTGIYVDAGAKLMHRAPMIHPGIAGTVMLEATLNAKGEVTDAAVLSGPQELRAYALRNVLQWHYAIDPAPPSPVRITLRFAPPATAGSSSSGSGEPAPAAAPGARAVLKNIEIQAPSPEIEQRVRAALPVREGDEVSTDTMTKVLAAAQQVDEHFTGTMDIRPNHDAQIHLALGFTAPAASAQPATSGLSAPPQRIRVGGNVQAANLITKVTPAYPVDAKAARVQGVVRFTALIGKDGTIQKLDLVTGDPMLAPTASEAVKQWVYKPTLLNGSPVEVLTQIDVNFTLAQ
jgi:outer membrane biosynthesis protein TonB